MDTLHSAQTDLLRIVVTRCTMLAKARIRMDAGPLDLFLAPEGTLLRIQDPAVVAFIGTLRMEGIPLDFRVRPRKPEGQVLCLMVGQGEGRVCVPLKAWESRRAAAEIAPVVPNVVLRDILGGLLIALTALRKPKVPAAPTPPTRKPGLAAAGRVPRKEVPRVLPR